MNPFTNLMSAGLIRGRIISLVLFVVQTMAGCDLAVVDPTNPQPESNFAYSLENSSCVSDCNVFFTNQSANATSYEWNFGDGSPVSNEVDPVHAYTTAGNYNVTLKAINEIGEHDTTMVVAFITTTGTGPFACLSVSTNNCTAPCTIDFTNCSTNSDTFEWDFGDGSATVTTESASHEYTTAGTFVVELTASKGAESDKATTTVTILPPETVAIALTHVATSGNTQSHMTTIQSANTSGAPDKVVVVTPVLGSRNDSPLGVYYYNNEWVIFNQTVTPIATNEKFHVLALDPDNSSAFVHETSAANIRSGYLSTIDHPSTNNNPNARIFIAPIWKETNDYNNHPVGVVYINNRWEIMNLDKASLPVGLTFNIVVSTDDNESFVHTASSTSIIGDYTVIDDPRTNAKASSKVFVTRNLGTSDATVTNPEVLGVWYRSSQGNWTIFHESGETMFTGARFNVLILD